MTRRKSIRGALAATAIIALSMTGVGTANAAEPAPSRGGDQAAARASLLAALQRDLDLTAGEAKQLLARQGQVAGLEQTMAAKLGQEYAGAWFDKQKGKLVVAATTPERAALARSAATETRVVKYSKQALEKIRTGLDAVAKREPRKVSAIASWAVDVQRNQVVVTARKGQSKAAATLVAGHGDAVRVEESAADPVLTADFLDGGDPFDNPAVGGCSVGFNVTLNGVGHFLTAGHCGTAGNNTSQAGVFIGPFVQSFFPDFDDALVRNDNPGFWIQGPWVFPYNGNPNDFLTINGLRDSPVGTAVCKSGRTTGLTCGEVTATDVSVDYVDGAGNPIGTVTGLTQHSACVEPGDSGGANFSTAGSQNFAEGMTSGAQLVNNTDCLEKHGQENVSWFFPAADSIAFYGVTLMTG